MANNSGHTSNQGQYYATTNSNRPSNGQEYHFPQGYTFQYNNNGWYYNDIPTSLPAPPVPLTSRATELPSAVQTGDLSKSKKSQKQRLRDTQDEPDSSTLVEDALPPPPHDPDERSSVLVLRPCSMAAADIPLNLRCAALIKADYPFRMCESCRTRFKLAELRNYGVRYEGKLVAKELPGEPRKGRGRGKKAFRKPRPQLIEYNGELVLDPAYMTSYQLDPKVFGAQAFNASAAAQEEAAFTKALKNVTSSFKQKSVDTNDADNNDVEGAVDGSVNGDAQVTDNLREEMVPATSTSSTVAAPSASYAGPSNTSNPPSKSSGDPLDGLMRVRICSVKNCHNPIPVDYFWKMCESCRILYRAWGVSKRARKREKRLETLSPEERERREAIRLNNKARLDAKNKNQDESLQAVAIIDFDPYVAPRPCTFATCKNHVPGDSSYKRCDYHRKQGRESHVKQVAKKEAQKAVWKKAVEEGKDPEEALRALLQEQGEESNDESDDSAQAEGSEKTKSKNKKAMDNLAARRNRENIHLCSVKDCQNLLQPDATWRICEICRMTDQINKRQKAAEARRRSTSVAESSKTKNVTPAPLQEATNDAGNLFQISTPATYTASSTTTTAYPALFTWSAAPSFVQHTNIPVPSSSLSDSQKIYLNYSSNSSSTLSMALQPTPSIAQHEAQRNSRTSTPQVNTVTLDPQQPEDLGGNILDTDTSIKEGPLPNAVSEQTDAMLEMDQNTGSADYNSENLHPQTDSFENTESYEDSPNANATLYGEQIGIDPGSNLNGISETSDGGANTVAPESPPHIYTMTSTTSLPPNETNIDSTLTASVSNVSTAEKTATQLSPRSKKARPSRAASSSKKAKQPAAAPPVPYMYPYPVPPGYPPFGPMPPYMPVPMTNPDGTPVPMPPYPYVPPFMMSMPPYAAQTQGQGDGKSTSAPAGTYPYPYPYPMPPPSAGTTNGSNGNGSSQTAAPYPPPYPITFTMPDGSQATYPSFTGYPYPYQPFSGGFPPYSQQPPPPVVAETAENGTSGTSVVPKSRKKASVPGSSVFSLNSNKSSDNRGHAANISSGASGSGITEIVSQNQLSDSGVAVTQNADAATDTAGVMDLSKVAAAEQYVRALMSRPTTPTGEVTPLSLSVLPADRMPAPDNAVVDNVTESNDQVNPYAPTSLKRKAVYGDNGEISGDDMLEHRPKTKICSLEKCNATLPISSSQKYCRDCRSKVKLKKKVMEMKKRLKLVGRSHRNLTGGSSTSKPATDDVDVEILQDDADAEGDADDEVDAEM